MKKPPGIDRWRQVDDLFDEALDLDPEGWESFLADRCGDDEELRHAISDLLAADRAARQFLGDSAAEIAAKTLGEAFQHPSSAARIEEPR